MEGLTLFHASEQVVERPRWNYAKDNTAKVRKDFGQGFYMCVTPDYPLRLYSDRSIDNKCVYLNEYIFDITGLNELTLTDSLYWAMITASHRSDFTKRPEWHHFRDAIRNSILSYDLIIGTISNDRLFSTMNDFLRGRCTDVFLLECLQYMKYPMQYVSKCDKSDERLKYVRYTIVTQDELRHLYEQQESERIIMESVIDDKQENHRILVREKRRSGDYSFEGRFFADIVDDWNAAGQPMDTALKVFFEGV